MSAVPLSRAAPKGIVIRWWQPGKIARLDCRSFTCTAIQHGLPWTPVFAPLDLELGEFRVQPPSPVQAEKLIVGKAYSLHVVLRNAAGEGIEDMHFTVQVL